MTTTEATELLPGNQYILLSETTVRLDKINLVDGTWVVDATHASAVESGDTLTISTDNPTYWLHTALDTVLDRFAGLRIGDVVRRGKGKLLWRITGLSASSQQAPVISLLSMPTGTGTSGLALSPQSFAVVGDEAIATLTKVER